MDPIKIGAKLTTLRGNKTQSTVAEAVGISIQALSNYETGSRIPRDEVKIALSKYYNTSIQELFYFDV
jgi:transcriptional regulator with XRE-family HTH domain